MTTEKELGEALKRSQAVIEIEGDLAKKTFRIMATDKAVWAVCVVSITVAVAAVVVTLSSGGAAAPVTGPTAAVTLGGAAAVLGMPTAITATGIAIAGGGVKALNKLRKYRMEKISDTKVILYKK